MLKFSEHIRLTTQKVQRRNNLLKALTGTTWGQETIILTYKAIGRSLINYGSPIWSTIISDSNFAKLQIAQNNAAFYTQVSLKDLLFLPLFLTLTLATFLHNPLM